jgi:outer membrane beta-barrel protein
MKDIQQPNKEVAMKKTTSALILFTVVLALFSRPVLAADKKEESPPPPTTAQAASDAGEEVDVSKITEKYWAQGKDTELGVVQNRKYTSASRLELGAFLGTVSSDPFLSVKNYGVSLGYHFNQYISVHALWWKASVSSSDALKTFESETNSTVNTNKPKFFYGGQVNYNFLYGKASLFGNMIIYVDLFVLGGLGVTDTESGKNLTPFVGLGQKIHLNKFMNLDLQYRIMNYNETILSKTVNPGSKVGERSNNTDAITLGVSFLF